MRRQVADKRGDLLRCAHGIDVDACDGAAGQGGQVLLDVFKIGREQDFQRCA